MKEIYDDLHEDDVFESHADFFEDEEFSKKRLSARRRYDRLMEERRLNELLYDELFNN